jgi:hypothetical protein
LSQLPSRPSNSNSPVHFERESSNVSQPTTCCAAFSSGVTHNVVAKRIFSQLSTAVHHTEEFNLALSNLFKGSSNGYLDAEVLEIRTISLMPRSITTVTNE